MIRRPMGKLQKVPMAGQRYPGPPRKGLFRKMSELVFKNWGTCAFCKDTVHSWVVEKCKACGAVYCIDCWSCNKVGYKDKETNEIFDDISELEYGLSYYDRVHRCSKCGEYELELRKNMIYGELPNDAELPPKQ